MNVRQEVGSVTYNKLSFVAKTEQSTSIHLISRLTVLRLEGKDCETVEGFVTFRSHIPPADLILHLEGKLR